MKFLTLFLCITSVYSARRSDFIPVLHALPEEAEACEPVTSWVLALKENSPIRPQEEQQYQQTIKGDQNIVNTLQSALINELRPLLAPFDQSLSFFKNEVENLKELNAVQAIQKPSFPAIENPVTMTLIALHAGIQHLEKFENLYQSKHANSQSIQELITTIHNFQGGGEAIRKEIDIMETFTAVDEEHFNLCTAVLSQLTQSILKLLPTQKVIQTNLKTMEKKLKTGNSRRGSFKYFPVIQFVQQYENYNEIIGLYHQYVTAYQRSFPKEYHLIQTAEKSVKALQLKFHKIVMQLQHSKAWESIVQKLHIQSMLPETSRTIGCCGYRKY